MRRRHFDNTSFFFFVFPKRVILKRENNKVVVVGEWALSWNTEWGVPWSSYRIILSNVPFASTTSTQLPHKKTTCVGGIGQYSMNGLGLCGVHVTPLFIMHEEDPIEQKWRKKFGMNPPTRSRIYLFQLHWLSQLVHVTDQSYAVQWHLTRDIKSY